ncbi:hypothetical protein CSUB01_04723 [Colletotrichum sublineola]|uniref:Uncharacterized protein n=1 Tax=Colletotrichum sublineola TaxID=1173701 RepID=A0A066XBA7_COLSU|nr:hypothetical protein CSUB01_04723 [Colletotrichum sublineola]
MVLHNDNSEEANALETVDDRTIDTLVLAQATFRSKSTKQIVDATATRPLGSEGPALPVTVLVRLASAIATVRGFQDGAWPSVSGIRTLSAGPFRERRRVADTDSESDFLVEIPAPGPKAATPFKGHNKKWNKRTLEAEARCATYSAMVPREARFDRVEWTPTPKEFRASLSILRDDEYTLSRSRRSEQRGSHMEYRAPPRPGRCRRNHGACHHGVIVENGPNFATQNQAMGRLWRLGQKSKVFWYILQTQSTIDPWIETRNLKAYVSQIEAEAALDNRIQGAVRTICAYELLRIYIGAAYNYYPRLFIGWSNFTDTMIQKEGKFFSKLAQWVMLHPEDAKYVNGSTIDEIAARWDESVEFTKDTILLPLSNAAVLRNRTGSAPSVADIQEPHGGLREDTEAHSIIVLPSPDIRIRLDSCCSIQEYIAKLVRRDPITLPRTSIYYVDSFFYSQVRPGQFLVADRDQSASGDEGLRSHLQGDSRCYPWSIRQCHPQLLGEVEGGGQSDHFYASWLVRIRGRDEFFLTIASFKGQYLSYISKGTNTATRDNLNENDLISFQEYGPFGLDDFNQIKAFAEIVVALAMHHIRSPTGLAMIEFYIRASQLWTNNILSGAMRLELGGDRVQLQNGEAECRLFGVPYGMQESRAAVFQPLTKPPCACLLKISPSPCICVGKGRILWVTVVLLWGKERNDTWVSLRPRHPLIRYAISHPLKIAWRLKYPIDCLKKGHRGLFYTVMPLIAIHLEGQLAVFHTWKGTQGLDMHPDLGPKHPSNGRWTASITQTKTAPKLETTDTSGPDRLGQALDSMITLTMDLKYTTKTRRAMELMTLELFYDKPKYSGLWLNDGDSGPRLLIASEEYLAAVMTEADIPYFGFWRQHIRLQRILYIVGRMVRSECLDILPERTKWNTTTYQIFPASENPRNDGLDFIKIFPVERFCRFNFAPAGMPVNLCPQVAAFKSAAALIHYLHILSEGP